MSVQYLLSLEGCGYSLLRADCSCVWRTRRRRSAGRTSGNVNFLLGKRGKERPHGLQLLCGTRRGTAWDASPDLGTQSHKASVLLRNTCSAL
ncbi:hypothetical protein AMECASPLE_008273 [Ameca splendens]|uniref:Uncharacterized protein n=1 Tax=Ameca splendens TaxID=208324 RepID=A0ABV0YBA9_9TELE